MTDSADSPQTDRRSDSTQRQLFLDVYDVLLPFFDPANQWAGQDHQHLAYRALHERFPQLAPDALVVMVTAAQRVFHSGRTPAP
ncbi:MAG: hypothetical protein M0P39_15150 [Rhodocyclaceae bacterium]|jgi:hypothetical protein|nr:hypothetical protein [Rhodocyclaceae bacterium]